MSDSHITRCRQSLMWLADVERKEKSLAFLGLCTMPRWGVLGRVQMAKRERS